MKPLKTAQYIINIHISKTKMQKDVPTFEEGWVVQLSERIWLARIAR